jgi:two-component system response regulator (stage 0 sporulation protein F)
MAARKILIIDDDSSVRECYGKLFRRAGYEPRLESCGVSVVRNLEHHRDVSLVVLDYRMPGINGLDLLRRLRMMNFTTAAVMVTAFATAEMLEEARQLGVRRVLSKPVNVSQLIEAVEQSLPTADSGETKEGEPVQG